MNKNDKVWIMANDVTVSYLTNGKWYEARQCLSDYCITDDENDIISVFVHGTSLTGSGVWNMHTGEFPPEPEQHHLPDHTQEIVEGLELVLNQRFDSYDAETKFLNSLIDKLRSGEYTITHRNK